MTTLFIVPSERHVEAAGLRGERAETRTRFAARLVRALAPEARFASPEITRLALTESLKATLWEDALLGPLVRAGGAAYLRTVELVDAAIGDVRRLALSAAALERAESAAGRGPEGLRAATLRRAIVALDRTLESRGLVDGRSEGQVLRDVLKRSSAAEVLVATKAQRVTARAVALWDPADVAWWNALGVRLKEAGGGAIVELPTFEQKGLDADRERDPLEALMDELMKELADAPVATPIRATLGDFVGGAPHDLERLSVVFSSDAVAMARAVVARVLRAIGDGAPVDRVAVAIARVDEALLVPLRAAFLEANVPIFEPRGAPAATAGIVATALFAHELGAKGLPRLDVALLLRSRYVDAVKITGVTDRREAKRIVLALADALEGAPSANAPDAGRALEETVVSKAGEALRPFARRVAETLMAIEDAKTRGGHARAARSLWDALGFPARVSLDARATLGSDAVATGLARAELLALSRDAHGWRVLGDAVDAYLAATSALGLGASPATSEIFRHELTRVLEAGAPPPAAGRLFAVRIVRLHEIAGEPLSHLFILGANDGALPKAEPAGPLFTEALQERLGARGPSSSSSRARELAQLAMAAAHAESVTLFLRETGDEGEALGPSTVVSALLRAGVPRERAGAGVLFGSPLSAREAALAATYREPERARPADLRRATTERIRERHHGQAATAPGAAPACGDLVVTPWLSELVASEMGTAARPLPVTALEAFARCPFQGYAQHLLGARDVKIIGETPDAREAGTLVHEALAAAMLAVAPLLSRVPVDKDAARALAMEAADRVLWSGSESTLRHLAIDLARERVVRVVDWSLEDESWIFEFAEQSFGDARAGEGAWPALAIPEAQTVLRGAVDRVDVSRSTAPRRLRVIDYKSSSSAVKEARRELGATMLQVPLYALAAQRALGHAHPSGLYVPVAELDPNFGEDAKFAKQWQELFEGDATPLKERVREIADGARAGRFAPAPERPAFCDRCSFDGVCRKPRFVADEDEEWAGS
ncbi:MAG: PD-(D/E)XK nuclease family protein [Myxococcales bacterium]|nr:PD-(D/E)XK nuclease family protein [Myxococcales bacterium]